MLAAILGLCSSERWSSLALGHNRGKAAVQVAWAGGIGLPAEGLGSSCTFVSLQYARPHSLSNRP